MSRGAGAATLGSPMIRVLIADDHPAVRVGLERLVRSEPGIVHVASVENGDDAYREAQRSAPDCVLMDYQMPGGGLNLCRELRGLSPPPGTIVYTAFAGERLALAALLAGVNAVVDKAAPAARIFDAIRLAARGVCDITPTQEALTQVAAELDPDQLPIFAMSVEGTPVQEIAQTLQRPPQDIEREIDRLLARVEGRLGVAVH